jgi:hypothetical protein
MSGGLGHYPCGPAKKHRVFSFVPAMRLLLNQTDATRFQFDREIAVLLLRYWAMWPDDNGKLKAIARLISAIVTFHRKDTDGHPLPKLIVSLSKVRSRFREDWYQTFYNDFFLHIGGIRGLISTDTRGDYDNWAAKRIEEMETSLDVLEYLLIATSTDSAIAVLRKATSFVQYDGFGRSGGYGIPMGDKRSQGRQRYTIGNYQPVGSSETIMKPVVWITKNHWSRICIEADVARVMEY